MRMSWNVRPVFSAPADGGGAPPAAPAAPAPGAAAAALGTPPGDGGAPPAAPGAQPAPTTITIHYDKLPPATQELFKAKGWTPEKLTDGGVIADSYFNANKAISGAKDVVALPGEGAAPEAWDKVYDAMGRPEKAEAYDYKLPADAQVDPSFVDWSKKTFHGVGLTQAQAEKLVANWQAFAGERLGAEQAEIAAANTAAIAEVKKSFGTDAAFDAAVAKGQDIVKGIGNLSPDTLAFFDNHKGSAAVIEVLAKLGHKLGSEAGSPLGSGTGITATTNPANMTPQQAQAEINRLGGDAEFQKKYTDKNHPEHKLAVDQMMLLHQRKAGK